MKRAVLPLAVACCIALPAVPSVAQSFDDRCFAVGDIAAQIAGWRKRHKTKAQALAQSHKYYGDGPDSREVDEAIETIYASPTLLTPDQATMRITQQCLTNRKARNTAQPAPSPRP